MIDFQNTLSPFEQLFRALRAKKKVSEEFLYQDNVVGVGVGYKISNERETINPSVVVSVAEKLPKAKLSLKDLIPDMIDDVYTDVIETGIIRAQMAPRNERLRPVQPGASIGHIDATAGTLGCLVRRGGELLLLSNNHVLAELDDAKIGDPIIQPGATDGGDLSDKVGELAGFIPITLYDEIQRPAPPSTPSWLRVLLSIFGIQQQEPPSPMLSLNNAVDAAIARLDPGVSASAKIVELNAAPAGILPPHLGMTVVKSGRTTGVTNGRIIQIDVTTDVNYGARKARFVDQVMTTPFSSGGDSGSLVLDTEQNAIGLLFAGSEKVGVVTPMQTVLGALNIELVIEQESVHGGEQTVLR